MSCVVAMYAYAKLGTSYISSLDGDHTKQKNVKTHRNNNVYNAGFVHL